MKMINKLEDIKLRNFFSSKTPLKERKGKPQSGRRYSQYKHPTRLTSRRQLTCGCSTSQSSEVGEWLLIADDQSGDRPRLPAIPKFLLRGGAAQLFLLTTFASESQILAIPTKHRYFNKFDETTDHLNFA